MPKITNCKKIKVVFSIKGFKYIYNVGSRWMAAENTFLAGSYRVDLRDPIEHSECLTIKLVICFNVADTAVFNTPFYLVLT